jgi:6-methylsalicylate decarboxylase
VFYTAPLYLPGRKLARRSQLIFNVITLSNSTPPRLGSKTWPRRRRISTWSAGAWQSGVLSLSAPGVNLANDAEGHDLARQVNEYHAEIVKSRPDRFGQFACIPLTDVDGSVAEAVYALDELHADGVVLLSNAGGKYLGDKDFELLWPN